MQIIKKIFFLLTSSDRRKIYLLLAMISLMSVFEVIGVASILPFVAVLSNQNLIETNTLLKLMFENSSMFGIETKEQFLFGLGVIVFLLLLFSLTFKAVTTYTQVRFTQLLEYRIGKRFLEGYIYQPYVWFLSRHSVDLGKAILSEVEQVIVKGINPLIELISKGMITVLLILIIILTDPKLALIVGLSLSLAYLLIFYFVQKKLNKIGQLRLNNNALRFKAVSEAFSPIKEVKIGRIEKFFIENFSNSAKIFAQTQAASSVIAQLPRFFLEALAFGGILLIILYIMSSTGTFNSALPIIALYVFVGYRLMPALQQIYSSITQLTFVGPSIDKLYDDFVGLKNYNNKIPHENITFKKKINLNNIDYYYPNTKKKTLKNINLQIDAKSIIGFIGTTGSGKTTIIDIILGLLKAQKGTLEVDGIVISENNLSSWQNSIGYVPQNTYLSDDTIFSNIAFGVDHEKIDKVMVEKASKIANLHKFVNEDLPKKYQTIIGERGIRLSGGQRQRIAIARALYHNPELLILDEATSALDNKTEKIVMDAINNLDKDKTIILISHRLSTLKKCDKIFMIEKGQVIKEGSYNELINSNENFKDGVSVYKDIK